MATLEHIMMQNFRNIVFADLEFSPGVNCICGNNGQGKTNLLDAVHFLSMTKSALGIPDRYCIRQGCRSFALGGVYRLPDGIGTKLSLSVDEKGKTVQRDGKAYRRISSHIGLLPIVAVSPSDGAWVSEGGEQRRSFVNSVLCQMDVAYMAELQKYNRLLDQRNHLLKEASPDAMLLDTLDCSLSPLAERISGARAEFTSRLEVLVAEFYKELSGNGESVGIGYRSDMGDGVSLEEQLSRNRQRDMILRFTSAGVQRDDFIFTMNGVPIRRCGSQGQQKSFIVAVKLAQYEMMRRAYGYAPQLLLDDLFDKLDRRRIAALMALVGRGDYGQIFITDTNRDRVDEIVRGVTADTAYFNAANGEFQTGEVE